MLCYVWMSVNVYSSELQTVYFLVMYTYKYKTLIVPAKRVNNKGLRRYHTRTFDISMYL